MTTMKEYIRNGLIFSGWVYILILFSFRVLVHFSYKAVAAEQPSSGAGIEFQSRQAGC